MKRVENSWSCWPTISTPPVQIFFCIRTHLFCGAWKDQRNRQLVKLKLSCAIHLIYVFRTFSGKNIHKNLSTLRKFAPTLCVPVEIIYYIIRFIEFLFFLIQLTPGSLCLESPTRQSQNLEIFWWERIRSHQYSCL